jgi:hypothetical protein
MITLAIYVLKLAFLIKVFKITNMNKVCGWENSTASMLVHNKKAVGAALFISFLGYTAAVILSEMKRGSRVSFTQDISSIVIKESKKVCERCGDWTDLLLPRLSVRV